LEKPDEKKKKNLCGNGIEGAGGAEKKRSKGFLRLARIKPLKCAAWGTQKNQEGFPGKFEKAVRRVQSPPRRVTFGLGGF